MVNLLFFIAVILLTTIFNMKTKEQEDRILYLESTLHNLKKNIKSEDVKKEEECKEFKKEINEKIEAIELAINSRESAIGAHQKETLDLFSEWVNGILE